MSNFFITCRVREIIGGDSTRCQGISNFSSSDLYNKENLAKAIQQQYDVGKVNLNRPQHDWMNPSSFNKGLVSPKPKFHYVDVSVEMFVMTPIVNVSQVYMIQFSALPQSSSVRNPDKLTCQVIMRLNLGEIRSSDELIQTIAQEYNRTTDSVRVNDRSGIFVTCLSPIFQ